MGLWSVEFLVGFWRTRRKKRRRWRRRPCRWRVFGEGRGVESGVLGALLLCVLACAPMSSVLLPRCVRVFLSHIPSSHSWIKFCSHLASSALSAFLFGMSGVGLFGFCN